MGSSTGSSKKGRARVAALLGGDVLESNWLRRLARISFLGTLDQHPRSRRSSNRLEHSLAVAELGIQESDALGLERNDARVVVAACLLHDVGHYPLSHAAEPAFKRVVGASHHDVTRWIVCGEGPIGRRRSLLPVLEARGIDPFAVWSVIDGRSRFSSLLRGSINLDTLDGITRVARDFRVRSTRVPARIFEWKGGEIAIGAQALEAMDEFWALKDRVYDRIINLPSNILAETRLCEMVRMCVTEDVFARFERFDDAELLATLKERFGFSGIQGTEDDDYELRGHAAWGQVLVRIRKRYFVEQDSFSGGQALETSRWGMRYRHVRESAYLISRREQLDLPFVTSGLVVEDPEI